MSVVVWDGKTIAADRQGTCCDMRVTEIKMERRETAGGIVVCAWTGFASFGKELAEWYFSGADKKAYPSFQSDREEWCRLIVAKADGCEYYERTPYPFVVRDPYLAWGSGRDFAMGALAMGADARRAVEVTNLFSTGCGLGVDAYDFGQLQCRPA